MVSLTRTNHTKLKDDMIISRPVMAYFLADLYKAWRLSPVNFRIISHLHVLFFISSLFTRGDHKERKRLQSAFKERAKAYREAFLTNILNEAETGFTQNRLGPACKAIRQLAGKISASLAPTVNKADGCPCESPDEVLQRWREHFTSALNHAPGTNSAELDTEEANTPPDPETVTDEPIR